MKTVYICHGFPSGYGFQIAKARALAIGKILQLLANLCKNRNFYQNNQITEKHTEQGL